MCDKRLVVQRENNKEGCSSLQTIGAKGGWARSLGVTPKRL